MAEVQTFAGAELDWVRTRLLPPRYSLRWNGVEVGTVAWEGLFSSGALLSTGENGWRLRRVRLRGFEVTDATSGEPVATLLMNLLGSADLTFVDGRTLSLRGASWLPPTWVVRDAGGSDLVTLRGRLASLFRGGTCRLEPASASVPEIGLVALLGVYLLMWRARRRARS